MNTKANTINLINALQTVANAFNLHVTKADESLISLDNGELIANVDGLMNRCSKMSIWSTLKDFAVRIDESYLESMTDTQRFALDNAFAYKLKKQKNKANERRYSFADYKDVIYFLSTLSAYATTKEVQTKEVQTPESVTA